MVSTRATQASDLPVRPSQCLDQCSATPPAVAVACACDGGVELGSAAANEAHSR